MERIDFNPLKELVKEIPGDQLRADIAKAVARIELKVNGLGKPLERKISKKVVQVSKKVSKKLVPRDKVEEKIRGTRTIRKTPI